MLGTEFVELGCQVATIAIKNEKPISTNSPVLRLWLEDLSKPRKGELISRPAIVTDSNPLYLWQF